MLVIDAKYQNIVGCKRYYESKLLNYIISNKWGILKNREEII